MQSGRLVSAIKVLSVVGALMEFTVKTIEFSEYVSHKVDKHRRLRKKSDIGFR